MKSRVSIIILAGKPRRGETRGNSTTADRKKGKEEEREGGEEEIENRRE